jgi:hypothetical protein
LFARVTHAKGEIMHKILPIVVAVITAVSLLGPAVLSFAGTLHLWLNVPSMAQRADRVAHPTSSPAVRAILTHAAGLASCLALAVALGGCEWWQAHEATVVPVAETIACDIAGALDPTQATLICAVVDAAGAIVESFEPITTTAASAAAFARRFPPVPSVHALVLKWVAR